MIKFILSGINSVVPLAGALTGLVGTAGIFGLGLALKGIFGTLPMTMGIPTLLSMFSWSSCTHRKTVLYRCVDFCLHVLLPTACIITFMTHPDSQNAWPYALYWLVTLWVARMATGTRHPFVYALQSTFVAHAVGSIMWVFLIPMTTGEWLALIPLVAIERFTLAAMSTVIYQAGAWLWRAFHAPTTGCHAQHVSDR